MIGVDGVFLGSVAKLKLRILHPVILKKIILPTSVALLAHLATFLRKVTLKVVAHLGLSRHRLFDYTPTKSTQKALTCKVRLVY